MVVKACVLEGRLIFLWFGTAIIYGQRYLSSDWMPPKACEGVMSLPLQSLHYQEVFRVSVVVVCHTH